MDSILLLFSLTMFLVLVLGLWMVFNSRKLLMSAFIHVHDTYIGRIRNWTGIRDGRVYLIFMGQVAFFILIALISYFIFANILLLLLVFFVVFKAPEWISAIQKKRRLHAIEMELPTALSVIASSLLAGVSLSTAIQSYAREVNSPLAQEFAHCMRLQKVGVDFEAAIEEVGKRIDLVDFQLLVMALRISKAVGGNLSETLISLSNTIQQKLTIEGKIKSLTAQGKMQGWVMICLPVLVGGALFFIQPDQMEKLLTTLSGKLVLAGCCILGFFGHKMIQKIMAIDV